MHCIDILFIEKSIKQSINNPFKFNLFTIYLISNLFGKIRKINLIKTFNEPILRKKNIEKKVLKYKSLRN